jgi:choline dehydrogenase
VPTDLALDSYHQAMKLTAEVVVIGGGSGGAVVAARLAEAGVNVVLMEAGPDYGPFANNGWPTDLLDAHALATSHDWGYGSGPVTGRQPWSFERARVLGGCSAHNGAIAAVGHFTDYDGWQLPGWTTNELRPLFATALEKMCVRTYKPEEVGPFHARCLEAAAASGWPMLQDLCDLDANVSFGRESVNIVNRIRWNTAFAYLDNVRPLASFSIVDRVLVDRIQETKTEVQVTGYRDGSEVDVVADRVVLCAGVYGTPAILQRSGVGSPSVLKRAGITCTHDLPGVGANLHDHPMVHADREVGPQLQEWLNEAAQRGALPEEQTLGKATSSLATDGIFDLHLFPVCASTQTVLTGGRAMVEVACVTPRSRGRVDVTTSDPSEVPRIDHRYLTDPDDHDITVLRDGLVLAEQLLNHESLASVLGGRVTDVSTDAAIRREVAHYYHPVGTCAMGFGSEAVCDHAGKVRGLSRTWVGDASLMPQIPRANTNIPAVVIGERVSRFLLADS